MEKWTSKVSGPANGLCQQWTATRCHRLLRPLLTHVAALRKEVDWQRSFCPDQNLAQSRAQEAVSEASGKRSSSDRDSFQARKKARYTYSLKTSKATSHRGSARDCPGEKAKESKARHEEPSREGIVLPTPVLKRARGHLMSSPVIHSFWPQEDAMVSRVGKCHHVQECCANRCVFELELATLRKTTAPSRFFLYESIFRALDALLRATTTQKPGRGTSKSLVAMCLRKVPEYVVGLELWRQVDAEANGTRSTLDGAEVSFEIYSDLESLGVGNCGWKHLSDVARAHGIKVVKDAISEGLIELEFSVMLARLCNESPSFTDRGELIEAIVSRQYEKPSGPDDWFAKSRETMPLEIFLPSSRKAWAGAFRARNMSNLLSHQLLPREWILTRDFGTIWSSTVRDIAGKSTSQDTITFIITSIHALCSHMLSRGRKKASPEEAVGAAQQTLIGALTALVTTALLGQQTLVQYPTISSKDRIRTINRRVEYIIRVCLTTIGSRSGGIRPSTYLLLLAAFFLDSTLESTESGQRRGNRYRTMLQNCWDDGPGSCQWGQRYEATLALMCSIAQCCGRGTTAPASAYLTRLCDRLGTVRDGQLGSLRRDAAFLLADQTGDLRDLAFAEGLEAGRDDRPPSRDRDRPRQTPGRGTAFAGFRWDEGISEWVTTSPAVLAASTRLRRAPPPSPADDPGARSRGHARRRREDSTRRREGDTHPASGERAETRAPGIETRIGGTSCLMEVGVVEKVSEEIPSRRRSRPQAKRKSAEESPRAAGDAAVPDSNADELWDDDDHHHHEQGYQLGGKENRPAHRAVEWHAPTKRRRKRGSLQSRQPLRTIANAYFDCDGSSGDELGL
ncbi:hypothetical protein QBC33DRAFT_532593 [Phialemonium atrogriseum]|uniref:Uncharacterized protein n=1 Tax=Phialemonium atrogriseum TaxID=1093897 RepID=A0AAJ0C569_9PEZI|nr:uncharacterized protein QBC33DRAFT_532593 [Phialemonium atrogriseum]KAK1769203.1 hypothetical protein QBC33DRAFT_532593 [Phialemonium atrogriseum]